MKFTLEVEMHKPRTRTNEPTVEELIEHMQRWAGAEVTATVVSDPKTNKEAPDA